jgi:hypothetical protein
MVNLTLDKPYTVHARSIDRMGEGHTPGAYKLVLRDPITCSSTQYMKATLVSAKIPSTFYQIDRRNNTFTVGFSRSSFAIYAQYIDLAVVSPEASRPNRGDYEREVAVTILQGNYNIEELLTEVKTKLNAACTDAHAAEPFRTFKRSNDTTSTLFAEDTTDAGEGSSAIPHVVSAPQYDWEYSKTLNKMRLYLVDAGGKMALGKWDIQTMGVKLGMALGFNHVSAQMLKQYDLPASVKTSVENSVHYRETTLTEFNDFTILTPTSSVAYGHTVNSVNCVNMFANDSVYIRITNLPSNAYETLYGAQTNVMAVIPMYSGSASENFHSPSNPTSTNIGSMGVSELDIKMTDAMGVEIDFNGVEHDLQLVFEAFANGTRADKPPDANWAEKNARSTFASAHRDVSRRHAAPYVISQPQTQVNA